MEVLDVQGTAVLKVYEYVSTGQWHRTRGRTSVDALSNLGCWLGTIDRPKQCCNAVGIADDIGRPSIEDRWLASYNRCSAHRNAIE